MDWTEALSPEQRAMLRDFVAMNRALTAYATRYSEMIGDFGEGYRLPKTKAYGTVLMDFISQTEAVAKELGESLGIVPEVWEQGTGTETESWISAVEREIRVSDPEGGS